ncbi:hypothetical protein LRS10_05430 [Phenylobacterium sp. J426]|uniref:hypothetical protein n=1 Tax=Phenylobacterium sp. J426 TaxID=2898439 RepID=UPI002150DA56|nr:hypothetical protein [Phenylobacterium sp. J426]MCR5873663.1 hypothetical protein [Phenylobacterium sp. J426]
MRPLQPPEDQGRLAHPRGPDRHRVEVEPGLHAFSDHPHGAGLDVHLGKSPVGPELVAAAREHEEPPTARRPRQHLRKDIARDAGRPRLTRAEIEDRQPGRLGLGACGTPYGRFASGLKVFPTLQQGHAIALGRDVQVDELAFGQHVPVARLCIDDEEAVGGPRPDTEIGAAAVGGVSARPRGGGFPSSRQLPRERRALAQHERAAPIWPIEHQQPAVIQPLQRAAARVALRRDREPPNGAGRHRHDAQPPRGPDHPIHGQTVPRGREVPEEDARGVAREQRAPRPGLVGGDDLQATESVHHTPVAVEARCGRVGAARLVDEVAALRIEGGRAQGLDLEKVFHGEGFPPRPGSGA